jgi:hypothetical protein
MGQWFDHGVSAIVGLFLLFVAAGIASLVQWSLEPLRDVFMIVFMIVVILPLSILYAIWTFLTG